MSKRISWKKGMRLSDEIMRASDNNHFELVEKAYLLTSAGRFGLFPSSRPFDLSLNISGDGVDVESLNCLALTKGGHLIDIEYDTKFTCPFDCHVVIPANSIENDYILIVEQIADKWQETNDGYEVPVCFFSLISSKMPVPENAVPIGRIVNDYGWRNDDVDFTPPCLFVSSHPRYESLLKQFSEIMKSVDSKARNLLNTNGKEALCIFWPLTQQLMITIDKERDLMTPMTLLSNVQKFVSAFTCSCELDEYLNLADIETFTNYVYAPYNYEDAYQRIKQGLELCYSISEKVEKLAQRPAPQPTSPLKIDAPTVGDDMLQQECTTSETTIMVSYGNPAAAVYFTIDGSTPSNKSERASKSKDGYKAKFDNGYRKEHGHEENKEITIKLMAIVGGISSSVSSYQLSLRKSLKFRNAIPI